MNFKEGNLSWDHGKHQNYFTDEKHKFTLAWHHKIRKTDWLFESQKLLFQKNVQIVTF